MVEPLTIEFEFFCCQILFVVKLEGIDKIVIREEFIPSIIHYLSKILK